MPSRNCPPKNDNKQNEVADALNKIQIEQLHKATLNFSNNSLETKKLCITVEVAVFTLLTGIYKEKPLAELFVILRVFGVIVPTLFYIVDVVLYYYQDRLRTRMILEENEIRKRHQLDERKNSRNKYRVIRSFFNGSQIMYLGLILIALFLPTLVNFVWRILSA